MVVDDGSLYPLLSSVWYWTRGAASLAGCAIIAAIACLLPSKIFALPLGDEFERYAYTACTLDVGVQSWIDYWVCEHRK